MANAQTPVAGALQMTDHEIAVENARGRTVGLTSVLTVAMFSGFVLASWFALRDASATSSAERLAAIAAHKLPYVLSGLFFSIASLLVAAVLVHIMFAARSRSTAVPKFAFYVTLGGPVLTALVYPAYVLAQISAANKFVDAPTHTLAVAKDLLDAGAVQATTSLYIFAQVLVAVAWVMTGLFGIRLGLLTRLVGAVAIAIGVANVLAPPLAALVQVFWIGAVALMLLGDGPQVPPAWKLGRPVPWREVATAAAAATTGDEDPADFKKSEQ